MSTILIGIHIAVCFFLIAIVLLQHGKGADMGATFGGSSQTVFGTEGPLPLLNKITTASAIIFMVTSLLLAQMSGQKTVMKDVAAPAPAAPAVEQTQRETGPVTIPMPDADKGGQQSSEFPIEK